MFKQRTYLMKYHNFYLILCFMHSVNIFYLNTYQSDSGNVFMILQERNLTDYNQICNKFNRVKDRDERMNR